MQIDWRNVSIAAMIALALACIAAIYIWSHAADTSMTLRKVCADGTKIYRSSEGYMTDGTHRVVGSLHTVCDA